MLEVRLGQCLRLARARRPAHWCLIRLTRIAHDSTDAIIYGTCESSALKCVTDSIEW
jgi:hypothetical protein